MMPRQLIKSRMGRRIKSQFGHPRGLMGRFTSRMMVRLNAERNEWAVSLLDAQPGDYVLEIGFGPGQALQQVAQRVTNGYVAGIDVSELMFQQAKARNAVAIHDGRLDLRLGSVDDLPFESDSFDKVYAVNSLHHWPDQAAGLAEIHRVLKPGGKLLVISQPRWVQSEDEIRPMADKLAALLTVAGFHDIQTEFKPLQPVTAIALHAHK
ncbi:MAG: methyltransferase domain-containing protein [Chloroflexi bacterium]|nr:methyltransferase domain-containing protein [Chloroflexota bacterium]